MLGRQVWGACDVGAGWGFAHRTQFARGNPFSRTGSGKYPVGSKPLCATDSGTVGLISLCTWSDYPLHVVCGGGGATDFSRETAYSNNFGTSVRHAQCCACRTHGEILKLYANIAGSLLYLLAGGGGHCPAGKSVADFYH